MKFNENLKYLRKEAKLTQEQLAEKLNVSRQAVTKWEKMCIRDRSRKIRCRNIYKRYKECGSL